MLNDLLCPYCQKPAKWVPNKEIYGKNYGKSYMCWLCKDCDSYVGCHNNTKKPLGTMAKKELRNLRKEAHELFDRIWKSGLLKRKDAYLMLKKHFGSDVHIGQSDEKMCQKIINYIKAVTGQK